MIDEKHEIKNFNTLPLTGELPVSSLAFDAPGSSSSIAVEQDDVSEHIGSSADEAESSGDEFVGGASRQSIMSTILNTRWGKVLTLIMINLHDVIQQASYI